VALSLLFLLDIALGWVLFEQFGGRMNNLSFQ
jgi:hypothetical protein